MLTISRLDPQSKHPQQEWQFSQETRVRIGRAPENEVVLADALEVSRHHLDLYQETPSRWRLVSHGANGTFLGGNRVTQVNLENNAIVELAQGGPQLQFVITVPQSSTCSHANNPPNNLFCIHCGEPLVETVEFVRQYQILRTLGRGGMGTTYLAWDKQGTVTGKPMLLVLKEMNADVAKIAKAQELFEREARILQSLDHPGIPQYYDFFIERGKKYLAMELIHGTNLEQRIYEKGTVPPKQAIEWMLQTCDILGYLHYLSTPLVHRDVKPANLLVRHVDNQVILLDFGAVKEIGTPLGTRIGAEGYSAPEQDRGQPCPQSDLYAIAPTLVFLLTGHSPLQYYKRKDNVFRLDVSAIPTIPPQLGQVIEKASEPKLKDRYQTMPELAAALANCL
ncbi:protein kinase [Spirulina sp. CS-785/01]|uniref:protein kinase domain-containing protein n=1 Tax=Spirulina sp. CS-785/01 TaxID=3021716 RepID=UPI00232E733E|nr:protein kinase [Spirulina sp. CS-785/01]MDB9315561.1 protein kinase [Spirulina sp. CS-785/01]